MTKKIDDEMMQMGEETFWDEFNKHEGEKTYIVLDENQEVIVKGARITTKKKKIKV